MSNILILAFLFFAGCLIGWGIEVIFRRFEPSNKARKWINPGFLIGPYLPLYGFGLCTLYLLAGLEKFIHTDNTALQKFILFLLMAIAMTVIELIAGEIFIVKMHVKLWDYSKRWGNIDGIICPLFSLFWTVLCALYLMFIHPGVRAALSWFADNLAFSFVIGFFFGVSHRFKDKSRRRGISRPCPVRGIQGAYPRIRRSKPRKICLSLRLFIKALYPRAY